MKKFLLAMSTLLLLVPLASCGGGKGNNSSSEVKNRTLKISVYLGGYGQVWINTLARAFEAENEGVHVEIEANPDLASEIPNRLQNQTDDDLFFSHGIAWEKAAVQGQLENLDDLYKMEVENGVKFEDRVESSFLSTAKFNNHYYKVPWTNGAGGLIYNAKMFRENGWEVPTTYEELVALCETIYNAKIKVDPTNTKPNAPTIKPFVWSSETYYWDYVVYDWWAQLAGVDKIKTYTELGSAEVFNPNTNPEQMKAFEAWVNLVAKNPLWSMEDSLGKQYMAAQMDFLNGYAAMIPCAQWLEMEMLSNIDPEIMEMAIMPTPLLKDAKKDNNGNPIRVNYAVGMGDSIIIPSFSKEKDLAKKFLLFMARNENLKAFTEKTNGVMLAMDYSDVHFEDNKLSTFAKGIYEINTNSKKFGLYSSSLLVLDGKLSIQWAPEGVQHYPEYFTYYNTSAYISNPSTYPEKNLLSTFNGVYETVRNNWNKWLSEIG
jgi:N-acetylglucosamine transport system substrate-binding protein